MTHNWNSHHVFLVLTCVCVCARIRVCVMKVFMREKQKHCLQEELGDKVLARIIKIQRWVRAKMLRCRFLHLRRNAITIQV